jgi:hypothetical protein
LTLGFIGIIVGGLIGFMIKKETKIEKLDEESKVCYYINSYLSWADKNKKNLDKFIITYLMAKVYTEITLTIFR